MDEETISLESSVAELRKLLLEERLAHARTIEKGNRLLERGDALQRALKDALVELDIMRTNLTASQDSGSRAVLELQRLRASEQAEWCRRDGDLERRCGYPDGRSGMTCTKVADYSRRMGPYLYACEEHAR